MASRPRRAPRTPHGATVDDAVLGRLTRDVEELRRENAGLRELMEMPAGERPAAESVKISFAEFHVL
jgi:hypothetical protein